MMSLPEIVAHLFGVHQALQSVMPNQPQLAQHPLVQLLASIFGGSNDSSLNRPSGWAESYAPDTGGTLSPPDTDMGIFQPKQLNPRGAFQGTL